MKNSGIQYIFLLIFIIVISYHNRKIFYQDEINIDHDKMNAVNIEKNNKFVGVECAYDFFAEKKIKMWRKTIINIKLNRLKNCTEMIYSSLEENGGSVFRVQALSVYEMVTSTATYIGNGTYEVQLLLTFPAKYTIMVLLVYVNGIAMQLKRHSRPLLRQLPGSPFHVNVFKDNSTSQVTSYCTNRESGTVAGRWVKCGGAIPGLERCGAWLSSDFDFDEINGFRWVPYTCQYHQYTNDQIRNCFARNEWDSIVLAGDTHMRYRAYHWATRFYGNCHMCTETPAKMIFNQVPRIEWVLDARGTRLPITFPNVSLRFEKFIHPRATRLKISNPYNAEALRAKLYILNFGNWLLQETNDVMLINLKLHSYGKAAKMLQNMGKVVVWLNTMSLPWRTDPGDGDIPPYRVKRYNIIADRVMRHYNIPVIDAFQISDGRIHAVYDRIYYAKNMPGNDFGGVVENTITNCIMNLLCNE